MFILVRKTENWRGMFRCDKCNKVIEDWDSSKALIYDEGGYYEPRSHFHDSCLPESEADQQIPLRELVRSMADGSPLYTE